MGAENKCQKIARAKNLEREEWEESNGRKKDLSIRGGIFLVRFGQIWSDLVRFSGRGLAGWACVCAENFFVSNGV